MVLYATKIVVYYHNFSIKTIHQPRLVKTLINQIKTIHVHTQYIIKNPTTFFYNHINIQRFFITSQNNNNTEIYNKH